MEPCLDPGHEVQCAGRIHRLGQTKRVLCKRFCFKDSFESAVCLFHDQVKNGTNSISNEFVSARLVNAIIDGCGDDDGGGGSRRHRRGHAAGQGGYGHAVGGSQSGYGHVGVQGSFGYAGGYAGGGAVANSGLSSSGMLSPSSSSSSSSSSPPSSSPSANYNRVNATRLNMKSSSSSSSPPSLVASSTAAPVASQTKWACKMCTVHNEPTAAKCFVCGHDDYGSIMGY